MSQPTSLQNKVFFITGASDGIGRATAMECAKRGATVIIHGKSQPKLEALYDEITGLSYAEPVIYPLNLEKLTPADGDRINETIHSEFGKLDALFINAGWLGAATPIQQFDPMLWLQVMQINLNASFLLTQACLPLLNAAKKSSIVFTLDDKASAYWGAYGVSKAGLNAFMHILADELESTDITVSGLLLDKVRTGFRTRAYPGEDPKTQMPVEDVVSAVMPLLANETDTIAGQVIHGHVFTPAEINGR